MQLNTTKRQPEIDFLRGIAVLLVLFRHFSFIDYLQEMGWIGVDLFFVLSGFLVSGLLFKEYKDSRKINGIQFLVRRGFKIYPVFYSFILFTIAWKIFQKKEVIGNNLWGELFFLQNYIGSFWNHTWSLAVEEHFYFILTLIIYFTSIKNKTDDIKLFNLLFLIIAFAILLLRFYSNYDNNSIRNLYYSHLRFDSLFFGVWLSHQFTFNKQKVALFVNHFRYLLLFIFIAGISFTPFVRETESYFTRTIGFTILYISFGSLLMLVLHTDLQSFFKEKFYLSKLYNTLCLIGFYSYSIYIIHILISMTCEMLIIKFNIPRFVGFGIYLISSVVCGIIISKLIEIPFLNIREKYFPKTKIKFSN